MASGGLQPEWLGCCGLFRGFFHGGGNLWLCPALAVSIPRAWGAKKRGTP